MHVQTLLTSGDIAKRLGEDAMMIRHIISSRGIAPCGMAGNVRIFPESAVADVKNALANITRRRRRKVALT